MDPGQIKDEARTRVTNPTKRARKRASVSSVVAALLLAAGQASSALGQVLPNPSDLDGRDFNGVRVPGSVQVSDATLRSNRVWVWTEGGVAGDVGPSGAAGSTQRMYLQGDVKLSLGGYQFTAANAVVWVQVLGPSTAKPGDTDRRVRQMAIVFDRVGDPGAEAGFSQAADRLLVTVKFDGVMDLISDSISPGKPAANSPQITFLKESEERFQKYLRNLATPTAPPGPDVVAHLAVPGPGAPIVPGQSRPFEPNAAFGVQTSAEPTAAVAEVLEPIFAKSGMVTFAVGTSSPTGATAPRLGDEPKALEYVKVIRGEEDNVVVLSGGVAMQYTDIRKNRNLQINAERAVVFLAPGPLTQLAQFGAAQVRGVYMEGDVVATDGQYTLRGPRVFYDLEANRAVMADAVFTTVDPRSGLPIYVRAATMKQLASNQFEAEKAKLSTSSFFTPTFAIGVSTVTITQYPPPGTDTGQKKKGDVYADSGWLTLRAYDTPVMLLPGYKGPIGEMPLSDIRVENSSSSGSALKTAWNMFSVLKLDRPADVHSDFLLDFYFDRGWALGDKSAWSGQNYQGRLFAYMLPNDDGHDLLSTGAIKQQDEQFRGVLLGENRLDLNDRWSLFTQISSQSDPSVVDGYFKDLSSQGREMETSGYLRYIANDSEFSVLGKGNLNSYVPNQYLLESQGYTVEKMPEAHYTRLADDLLSGVAPGLVSWSSEYSVARMRLQFNQPVVSDFGFINAQQSQAAFGLNPNQSLADKLKAEGLNENFVTRWDTRQELSATLDFDPFKVVPFGVIRYTGYDTKFGDMNAFAPDAGDTSRTWYAAGVRASTQIERIDDSVESSFFDLHRTRHIIEPSVTAWSAGSTASSLADLPVYDATVEPLNTGSAIRAGVDQTWQTQRGGPGRWQSVDVLKVSTDFVFAKDFNTTSPIGEFFDSRPEFSYLGNFFSAKAEWKASDVVSLGASDIYDFDTHQQARSTMGAIVQHSPEFSTYAQMRYLNAYEATYVDWGFNYQLTRIYNLATSFTYDTSLGEVTYSSATLRRRWPEATIGVTVNYNAYLHETSVSAVFEPNTSNSTVQKTDRLRDLGR